MAESRSLAELWEAHERAPFPAVCRGREVGGVDLVLLDSTAAGGLATFIAGARLSEYQWEILSGCRSALDAVVPALEGEAADYFGRLRAMAALALSSRRT